MVVKFIAPGRSVASPVVQVSDSGVGGCFLLRPAMVLDGVLYVDGHLSLSDVRASMDSLCQSRRCKEKSGRVDQAENWEKGACLLISAGESGESLQN